MVFFFFLFSILVKESRVLISQLTASHVHFEGLEGLRLEDPYVIHLSSLRTLLFALEILLFVCKNFENTCVGEFGILCTFGYRECLMRKDFGKHKEFVDLHIPNPNVHKILAIFSMNQDLKFEPLTVFGLLHVRLCSLNSVDDVIN